MNGPYRPLGFRIEVRTRPPMKHDKPNAHEGEEWVFVRRKQGAFRFPTREDAEDGKRYLEKTQPHALFRIVPIEPGQPKR